MGKKNFTLFGFNLTQKQSIQIFIISVVGVIISVFLLMTMLPSLIMSVIQYNTYYDPYYDQDDYYIIFMIISMLPFIVVICGTLLLSLYSLIRCRKIAKYYSPLIDPVLEPKPKSSDIKVRPNSIAQFCSNCGKMKEGLEKFCTKCGHPVVK